jgi:hypothetical protein
MKQKTLKYSTPTITTKKTLLQKPSPPPPHSQRQQNPTTATTTIPTTTSTPTPITYKPPQTPQKTFLKMLLVVVRAVVKGWYM